LLVLSCNVTGYEVISVELIQTGVSILYSVIQKEVLSVWNKEIFHKRYTIDWTNIR